MKRVLWVVLMLLVGCKTQVAGLQQDPSFDKNSFQQNPILVAGVVDAQQKPDKATVIHQSELLKQIFLQKHKHLTLISIKDVYARMGEKDMQELWLAYQQHQTLSEPVLLKLHQKFPQARYVMIAEIEQNTVKQYRDKYEEDELDWEQKPTGYKRVTIAKVAERHMQVSLLIYDMKSKLRAWYGRVNDMDAVSNASSDTFSKSNSLGESLVAGAVSSLLGNATDGVFGLSEPDMPQPPPVEPLLIRIFEGFAENMPG